jgi:titin
VALIIGSTLLAVSVAATAATPPRPTHLPAELARLHAEALRDRPTSAAVAAPAAPRVPDLVHPMTGPAYGVTNFQAQGGDQRLWVTWTPAAGIPAGITYYVHAFDVTNPNEPVSACGVSSIMNGYPSRNCPLTGLSNGHQYTVTLFMCDNTGCGSTYTAGPVTVARWPDPVSNLVVTGGNNSITATWSPPVNNGGLRVTQYLVEIYPASQGYAWCYTTATAIARVANTRVTFSPATASLYNGAPVNGTAYRVTIFALNNTIDGYVGDPDCSPSAGVSQDLSSTAVVAGPVSGWQQPESGQYTPLSPVTLAGANGTSISAGATLSVPVRGVSSVPTTGVAAVTLAVSESGASAGGSVYVWNSDGTQPANPTLRTNTGGAATTVTVPVGASGSVKISSTVAGTVHVDALGFVSDGTLTTPGSRYMAVPPAGLYTGTVVSSLAQPISLNDDFGLIGGIRPDAIALEVSVRVSGASASGSVTLEANSSTAPDAPDLYYAPGQVTSSVTQVSVDSAGQFLIRVSAGTTTVQLRVIGYYTGPLDPSGGRFAPATQTQVSSAAIAAGSSVSVPWPTGAPTAATEWLLIDASAVMASGTLSVYSTGNSANAIAVSVTAGAGSVVLVPVPRTSADGSVVIASDTAVGTVTVDIAGYSTVGAVAGQPTAVQAAPLASGAYVSWIAPCSDGGAPVSTYQIVAFPGNETLTVDGTQTDAFMYGLADGQPYTFQVTAINAAGAGPGSTLSTPITPAASVPDPPDQAAAQAGDAKALVTWDTPAHNGDSGITGYTVTVSDGTSYAVSGGLTNQLLVTGLTNGTAYSFQVAAVNAIGTGQASLASILVTPTSGAQIAPALLHRPGGQAVSTVASAVPTCASLAALPGPAAAGPGAATTTRYQLGDHVVTVTTPPTSLDIGTASLTTLHKYGYARKITTAAALTKWQQRIGHSHAVPVVPCIAPGHTTSSEGARAAGTACTAAFMAAPASNGPSSTSGGTLDSLNWAGIIAMAHDRPAPPALGAHMDTGDPFQVVDGTWQQGTFTTVAGGTNDESTWVGIGGFGAADSHDQMNKPELIQAGTDQKDNATPLFWWEVISWHSDLPEIVMSGITPHPNDNIEVTVTVYDADKAYPLSPISQADYQAGQDNSSVVFSVFDLTTGTNASMTVTGIYTEYDGRTAEWIDETPTLSNLLSSHYSVLPKFTTIKWLYADAVGSYNNPYLDEGTPYQWDWYTISLTDNAGHCLMAPTNVNINSSDANWQEVWHPSTC